MPKLEIFGVGENKVMKDKDGEENIALDDLLQINESQLEGVSNELRLQL
ncbi:1858_t:CDS:2, partial [Entrophospora sp. SA101]